MTANDKTELYFGGISSRQILFYLCYVNWKPYWLLCS